VNYDKRGTGEIKGERNRKTEKERKKGRKKEKINEKGSFTDFNNDKIRAVLKLSPSTISKVELLVRQGKPSS